MGAIAARSEAIVANTPATFPSTPSGAEREHRDGRGQLETDDLAHRQSSPPGVSMRITTRVAALHGGVDLAGDEPGHDGIDGTIQHHLAHDQTHPAEPRMPRAAVAITAASTDPIRRLQCIKLPAVYVANRWCRGFQIA